MGQRKRIAVLGLYNSGSTAVAGMLAALGVNMGPPFWAEFYEPCDLSWHLRRWWQEPLLRESAPMSQRVNCLRKWMELQECLGHAPVGAKHPLLSLCGSDLREAWGEETLFIWSYRSLEASIEGLKRRRWWPGQEENMQRQIWQALHEFEQSGARVWRIEWSRLKADAVRAAHELASRIEIESKPEQIQAAAAIVNPSKRTYESENVIRRWFHGVLKSRVDTGSGMS
jgi:hypothetical protein